MYLIALHLSSKEASPLCFFFLSQVSLIWQVAMDNDRVCMCVCGGVWEVGRGVWVDVCCIPGPRLYAIYHPDNHTQRRSGSSTAGVMWAAQETEISSAAGPPPLWLILKKSFQAVSVCGRLWEELIGILCGHSSWSIGDDFPLIALDRGVRCCGTARITQEREIRRNPSESFWRRGGGGGGGVEWRNQFVSEPKSKWHKYDVQIVKKKREEKVWPESHDMISRLFLWRETVNI